MPNITPLSFLSPQPALSARRFVAAPPSGRPVSLATELRPIAPPSTSWLRRQTETTTAWAPTIWPAQVLAPQPVTSVQLAPISPQAPQHQASAIHKPRPPVPRKIWAHGPQGRLWAGFITPSLRARTQEAIDAMPEPMQAAMADDIRELCRHFADVDAPALVPMMLHALWDVAPGDRHSCVKLCQLWVTPHMPLSLRQRLVSAICSYAPGGYAPLHKAFSAFVWPGLTDQARVHMLERLCLDVDPKQIHALRQQCSPVVQQLAPNAEHIAELVIYLATFNRRPDESIIVPSDDDDADLTLETLFDYDDDNVCCALTNPLYEQDLFENALQTPLEGVDDEHAPHVRELRREQRRLARYHRRYNLDNVMQSGRSQSARKAITALERQVHNPLHMLVTLKIIEIYLRNIQSQPALQIGKLGKIRAGMREIDHALRVLTGDKPNHPIAVADRFGLLSSTRSDFSKALIHNEMWTTKDQAPFGMGQLCALVWQAIAAWTNPLETPEELEKTKELLRYSFVLNVAENIEDDGHQVCNTGVCQRLVTTMQGYYGIKMDLVSAASLLNELARDFALKQGDAEAPPEMVAAFYESASKQAELYFRSDQHSFKQFKMHLQEYLNQSEMYYGFDAPPVADAAGPADARAV